MCNIEMRMIAIIDYNAGNVQSVKYALERLGASWILTDKKEEILKADKVLFPGQGEASTAMHHLRAKGLDELIPKLTQPFLGICLGLQLLCKHSEENDTDCLGLFDINVKKFSSPIDGIKYKVPQMGWNTIENLNSPLMEGIDNKSYVYFVHSYYAELSKYAISTTEYGCTYSSALQKDNFYACQFHPEKSSDVGQAILKNFLNL